MKRDVKALAVDVALLVIIFLAVWTTSYTIYRMVKEINLESAM